MKPCLWFHKLWTNNLHTEMPRKFNKYSQVKTYIYIGAESAVATWLACLISVFFYLCVFFIQCRSCQLITLRSWRPLSSRKDSWAHGLGGCTNAYLPSSVPCSRTSDFRGNTHHLTVCQSKNDNFINIWPKCYPRQCWVGEEGGCSVC